MFFFIKEKRVNGGEKEIMIYLRVGKMIVWERGSFFGQNYLLTSLEEVRTPLMTGQHLGV